MTFKRSSMHSVHCAHWPLFIKPSHHLTWSYPSHVHRPLSQPDPCAGIFSSKWSELFSLRTLSPSCNPTISPSHNTTIWISHHLISSPSHLVHKAPTDTKASCFLNNHKYASSSSSSFKPPLMHHHPHPHHHHRLNHLNNNDLANSTRSVVPLSHA